MPRPTRPAPPRFSASIKPRPPFDFSLTAAIFSVGDPQIRISNSVGFMQALDVNGMAGVIHVRHEGTLDQPEIAFDFYCASPPLQGTERAITQAVSRIFSTGDDLEQFYTAVSGDRVMSALTQRLRGLRCPATPTFFEALIDSVIEQQISLAAARSIENRLIRALGKPVTVNGSTWYCYPAPEALADTPDALFRSCGLTIRKGEYIRGISRLVADRDLDLEDFRNYTDTETIIHDLVRIRGIGRWTAELAILRGLHRPDAFPADDIGIRRFISRFYYGGGKVSPAMAREVAGRWGPYGGFAAYYLEIAELLDIQPCDLSLQSSSA